MSGLTVSSDNRHLESKSPGVTRHMALEGGMGPEGVGIQSLSDEWGEVSVAAMWARELPPTPAVAHIRPCVDHSCRFSDTCV